MKLWHETKGKGSDLVLLHGWCMNSAVWEPVIDRLVQHFSVTCIDLPGHGFSTMSETETTDLKEWSDAIAAVVPDNAIWLGWSLGGLLALQAALNRIINIRALFMMTATPSFMQRDGWQCAMPEETLTQFSENLNADVKTTLTRFLSLQIQGCDNARDLLKTLRSGFAQRPPATFHALETGLGFLRDTDLRQSLKAVDVPVHWVYGNRDTLTPACAADEIIAMMPAATSQIIQGAAHVPFLSHLEQVMPALLELEQKA
ncbi:MAG: pimeloyl-ACP methyl ester esterase BioH [Gammaproteobacteria bacterium]|nr:pimeloyl-ACP methyl ester esterase BioH [Gammaproteobacteria bacterium]